MEHNPEAQLERLRQASQEAIRGGDLLVSAAQSLMQHQDNSLG